MALEQTVRNLRHEPTRGKLENQPLDALVAEMTAEGWELVTAYFVPAGTGLGTSKSAAARHVTFWRRHTPTP